MPASAADIGFTTTFGIESATPGTYTLVAEVTKITPPGFSREAVEVTHLNSPDRFAEFIAGMNKAGPATIVLNLVPSATDALVTAFLATSGSYQITFPNAVTLTFSGFVLTYELDELSEEAMTATATFQPSGKPVLA